MTIPTPLFDTPYPTTLAQIEREEDLALEMRVRVERLRELRERFGIVGMGGEGEAGESGTRPGLVAGFGNQRPFGDII